MFGYLRKFLGLIKVTETPTRIRIEGLPQLQVSKEVTKRFETSRVLKMVVASSSTHWEIPKFFAVDLLYIAQELRDTVKSHAVASACAKMATLLESETWLKTTKAATSDILNLDALRRLKFQPKPHQAEFFARYNEVVPKYQLRGLLLAAPPGTGKTYTAIALCECAGAERVIVVCPKNALYRVWQAGVREQFRYTGPAGGPDDPVWIAADGGVPGPGVRYLVFHYENIELAVELAKAFPAGAYGLVVDECHNFSNHKSLRSVLLLQLNRLLQPIACVPMSGTPVTALGTDIITTLYLIDPFFTDEAMECYRAIYTANAKRATEILNHRMGIITYKVPKVEVVDIIPIVQKIKIQVPDPKRFHMDTLKLEMQQYVEARVRHYRAIMRDVVAQYERCLIVHQQSLRTETEKRAFATYHSYVTQIRREYDPATMVNMANFCRRYEETAIMPSLKDPVERRAFDKNRSVVKYMALTVQGEALANVLGKRRTECTMELVKRADLTGIIDNSRKKTLIFASYIEVLETAVGRLEQHGYSCARVYGKHTPQLAQTVSAFEKDPALNPLAATFQSLSTAVPLIMANTTIMCNQPFRDHEWDQTVSRTTRIGQDTQTYVFELQLDTGAIPNISTRTDDILEWSRAQIAAIMGTDPSNQVTAAAVVDHFAHNEHETAHKKLKKMLKIA